MTHRISGCVLQVITNHEAMNKIHYALAMKRLYKVGDSMEPGDFTQYCSDLLNHKGFEVRTRWD